MDRKFWQDKRVFITGVAGLLGSWLTTELVAQGADVVGLIRDQDPKSLLVRTGRINQIAVANGNICDYEAMERIIAEYETEVIFHLAAQTQVGIANRAPMSTFETNVKGTWTVLEAARRNSTVQAILVASSDKAYGPQTELPYPESAPLQGQYPYDVSKTCADLISRSYAHTYDLPVAVTRFANLYGGGDLNWNRLIPGTMRSALRGEQPIVRSDGTFKRDFIYVKDAVRGYMLLAENIGRPGVQGEAFNFGTDSPISVLEMINSIIAQSDYPNLKPIILDEVKHEIQDQYLSATKIKRVLGWQPQYTLESGLRETMDWYRAFLDLNPVK
ncbi:MAG: NAD-dependent epimerase/dehydratase family protein [Chloroflexi bacterium]|nr:NAD-dependent epimerase/dehydratase family protein [Chloroflexota bacterium]